MLRIYEFIKGVRKFPFGDTHVGWTNSKIKFQWTWHRFKFYSATSTTMEKVVSCQNVTTSISSSTGLGIVHINPRSVCNKFADVRQFILNSNYNIIAISESWLRKDIPSELYSIYTYKLFRKDREGTGGGVMLYIQWKLGPVVVDTQEFNNDIECLAVRLRCKNLSVTMCVIYRPPTIASTELQFMYDILPELSHNCDVFICTGDFNVNLLNQNTTDCNFFVTSCNHLVSYN